jgi:hypothetical protein
MNVGCLTYHDLVFVSASRFPRAKLAQIIRRSGSKHAT